MLLLWLPALKGAANANFLIWLPSLKGASTANFLIWLPPLKRAFSRIFLIGLSSLKGAATTNFLIGLPALKGQLSLCFGFGCPLGEGAATAIFLIWLPSLKVAAIAIFLIWLPSLKGAARVVERCPLDRGKLPPIIFCFTYVCVGVRVVVVSVWVCWCGSAGVYTDTLNTNWLGGVRGRTEHTPSTSLVFGWFFCRLHAEAQKPVKTSTYAHGI